MENFVEGVEINILDGPEEPFSTGKGKLHPGLDIEDRGPFELHPEISTELKVFGLTECIPQADAYFVFGVVIILVKKILVILIVLKRITANKNTQLILQYRERNINPPAVLELKSIGFIPVCSYPDPDPWFLNLRFQRINIPEPVIKIED